MRRSCAGRRRRPTVTLAHDRVKQRVLPEGVPVPFLVELGVMTAEGKVRAQRFDKFRQVNRFLELVEDVLPSLPAEGPLRVVDFGSGKSYLTFALHHLLTVVHEREAEIVGLDLKADVVDHCEALARTLGADGLRFEVGDIAGYAALEGVDLVVSLHACDTATDDALDRAVRAAAPVILAVPCCQHELLSQLDAPGARSAAAPRHAARAVRRRGDGCRAGPAPRRRGLRRAGGRVHRAGAHAEEHPVTSGCAPRP